MDPSATGENWLIIADQDQTLKAYKGTQLSSEHALIGKPTALACYYSDTKKPRVPCIAVAIGSYIFTYRNLRPYYKFEMPAITIAPEEKQIWDELKEGTLSHKDSVSAFSEAHDKGIILTSRTMSLLALTSRKEQEAFIDANKELVQKQMVCKLVNKLSQKKEHNT